MPFLGALFLFIWIASGVRLVYVFVCWIKRRRKAKAAAVQLLQDSLSALPKE